MKKNRLDDVMMRQGLVSNKDEAFVMVTEGKVFVGGQKAVSPSQPVLPEVKIELQGEDQRYVGRGAHKLKGAMDRFEVNAKGKICADIGAATGGFTEILLEYGAKKVYAIDTTRGKLAVKLREDPRVVVMERTDVRDLQKLPELVSLITIDISLVSLRDILRHTIQLLEPEGTIVALFKPQYEAKEQSLLRHGIVKDEKTREKLLHAFMKWARDEKWRIADWMESPIRGSEGNVEYLLLITIEDKK